MDKSVWRVNEKVTIEVHSTAHREDFSRRWFILISMDGKASFTGLNIK
ncbi:hypothetical protein [Photobacterium sanguinicancri]|nr:hypothetical protein [Photobacterium sanguinicancri]